MVPNESPAGHYGGWVMSYKRGGRLAHVLIRHPLNPNLCVLGLGKRKDCAFQPMLMRREPLSDGLFVEEFVELNPRARRGCLTATAPLRADHAASRRYSRPIRLSHRMRGR